MYGSIFHLTIQGLSIRTFLILSVVKKPFIMPLCTWVLWRGRGRSRTTVVLVAGIYEGFSVSALYLTVVVRPKNVELNEKVLVYISGSMLAWTEATNGTSHHNELDLYHWHPIKVLSPDSLPSTP